MHVSDVLIKLVCMCVYKKEKKRKRKEKRSTLEDISASDRSTDTHVARNRRSRRTGRNEPQGIRVCIPTSPRIHCKRFLNIFYYFSLLFSLFLFINNILGILGNSSNNSNSLLLLFLFKG